jgi:hypothetical protein
MKTNILAIAAGLSDQDLLARLHLLAGMEREASVELLAHLAALDTRPAVYAAEAYGSLFRYCTLALRLSEDAACNRIEAAHQSVLARARGRSRSQIEALVAELAPQTDVPSVVRKLPTSMVMSPEPPAPAPAAMGVPLEPAPATAPSAPAFVPTSRPIVRATAPERYRVQFTIGQDTHEKLRRVQALLRREIPDGDPGKIFDRALTLLLEKVEKAKLGAAVRPRPCPPIRPGTDNSARSRNVPRAVKRVAWKDDGGQCGFVSPTGRRCSERTFLEFHHVQPHARQGPATIANISLRCWRHNQYEAELIFGPHRPEPKEKRTRGDG